MKTRILIKTLLTLGLVFVLGTAITQVRGQGVVTIHSAGDVTRGETGSFVVNMNRMCYALMGVNFSVSGTAIPGVDYVPLVSPGVVRIIPCHYPQQCTETCRPGIGGIKVPTLPDPRGSFFAQPYSVVVSLKAGGGYTIGEPSSAQMTIYP